MHLQSICLHLFAFVCLLVFPYKMILNVITLIERPVTHGQGLFAGIKTLQLPEKMEPLSCF